MVLLHGFLLLILPLRQLQALYRHLISGAPLLASWVSEPYGQRLLLLVAHLATFLVVYPLQRCCGPLILSPLARLLHCCGPVILSPMAGLLIVEPFRAALLLCLLSYWYTHHLAALSFLKRTFNQCDSDWNLFLGVLWQKAFVPIHFALYWLLLFCANLFSQTPIIKESLIWGHQWYFVGVANVGAICDSPLTVLATAIAVSYAYYFFLFCTKVFLEARLDIDNLPDEGGSDAMFIIVVFFYSSLIYQTMSRRITLMGWILFFELSSVLTAMLDITEPVMLSISATHRYSSLVHLRVFSLALVLLVLPLYFISLFLQLFISSLVDLITVSNFILTSLKALHLFVVYGLFLYDYRAGGWEGLDDALYFTRAAEKVLEFVVSVFIITPVFDSETWSVMYLVFLGWHCYGNIWLRWWEGWQSYMLRREAVKKCEWLKKATPEALAKLEDPCAICYGGMKSGCCITPCQHYFHRSCLRKWLHIQCTCPLCQQSITPRT